MLLVGFYPGFTDNSEKAHNGPGGIRWRNAESTQKSLNEKPSLLPISPGVTLAQVGRELGINPNMLSRWRRQLSMEGSKAFSGQGHVRDEEMAKLKRELSRVKKERDFLKEAAAFFAKESR